MNWRLKSAIQRFCGSLPVGSDLIYYRLQRRFGSLRHPPPPTPILKDAISFAKWLTAAGISVRGLGCMEVGTGRRVDLPFGLFLLGARSTHTFDLNRYLKPELVELSLEYMRRERATIEEMFVSVAEDRNECLGRVRQLLQQQTAADALAIAGITYHAPADAAHTGLPAQCIDLHYSYTVDEHIPAAVLTKILREATRVLAPAGMALHHIDPSDHFSHEDPTISSINFLRFTEQEWHRHGGNKYAYHNRLRAHEHVQLFEACGFEVVRQETTIDDRALQALGNGFPLAADFRRYTAEQLSGSNIRILARASSNVNRGTSSARR
jgi:hypothetical protein